MARSISAAVSAHFLQSASEVLEGAQRFLPGGSRGFEDPFGASIGARLNGQARKTGGGWPGGGHRPEAQSGEEVDRGDVSIGLGMDQDQGLKLIRIGFEGEGLGVECDLARPECLGEHRGFENGLRHSLGEGSI